MNDAASSYLVERPDRFFINGEWTAPSSDRVIELINPATEEPLARVAEAMRDDLVRAIAAARNAFDNGPWPRMTPQERAGYLRAIAAEIRKRQPELSRMWTSEVGMTATITNAFLPVAADLFDFYASTAETFAWIERHKPRYSPGAAAGFLVREAVGVVGAIVPWNGSMMASVTKCAPALIAGCTIILKASPESPGGALQLAEIAEAVGLPPGVLNVVTADREVSELLVRHPDVDKITFTGSDAAGKRIGAICGERVARCTLELGGKSAAIILDDYDLEEAAARIASSAMILNGQACSSLTRLIVTRERQSAFADALAAAFAKIEIGDPLEAATDLGPLAMKRQLSKVEYYISKGQEEGARLVYGGKRPTHLNRGYFIEPTIFSDVHNSMAIAQEEIFGPVVSIIAANSERDAVQIANDSPFGLNASVFTPDAARAFHLSRQLRSGTVGHNVFRTDYSIAFGGFKQSGIGREGGVEGLLPFLESKTVILEGNIAKLDGTVG